MTAERPIGVFDSGIGGLTVVHALLDALPAEDVLYLGDTGRWPYGTKSADTIRRYSLENTEFLLARDVKMIVVACNSATAAALDAVRERAGVPVVGVIEPGARAAAARSVCRRVGVIGTDATISAGTYTRTLQALAPDVEVYSRSCPLFVPLAEEGWTTGPVAQQVAERYLGTLSQAGVDVLVLGCTHYPLLREVIGDVMGPTVALVDSAEETAREVATVLERAGLARAGRRGRASFVVTDVPDRFVRIGRHFLGERVESAVRLER